MPLAMYRSIRHTKIVFLLVDLVELGRSNIHGDVDLSGVSSKLNGIGDEIQSLLGGLNIGGNLE